MLALPTKRSLATAHEGEPAPVRELVVVGVETVDGGVGWGECSALNAPTYTAEWAADSFDRLAAWADGAEPPNPHHYPMAAAAIEMATIDAALREAGRSLADHLGATAHEVTAGATIGLADVATSVAQAEQLVADGYRKLKVKIDPNQVDDVAHELTHVFGAGHGGDDHHHAHDAHDRGHPAVVEVQVDANGSLSAEHLMTLLGLSWHGVSAIEQPFPVDRPDLAAELMLGTDAIVIADEAVASTRDAERLHQQSAMRAVAIKPPRLGGIDAAVELLQWCRTHEIGASIGGMLESGLGRHALAAVAALDGFTVTGDLSPARQWLVQDPWPDIEMVNGSIVVPRDIGVAPLPDPSLLDQLTVRRVEHRR